MADVETIHELKNDELINALEERAAQIIGQIGSTSDPALIRSLGKDAQMLLMQVPQGSVRAGNAINRINEAIAIAGHEAAEAESDESTGISTGGPLSAGSLRFQNQVYQFMSGQEQQFFNSINPNTQYQMARINDDGSITSTGQTVSGAQLREDFSRIEYHSLSEEKREGIILPEGGSGKPKSSEQEIAQLDKLNESLHNMEEYKAQKLLEEADARGEEVDQEQSLRCRDHFQKARGQVENLQDRIRRVKELRDTNRHGEANLENAKAETDRHELRRTLKKDIIKDSLLDDKQDKELGISGGQHVDRERSGQFTRQHTQMDETAIQQGGRGGRD